MNQSMLIKTIVSWKAMMKNSSTTAGSSVTILGNMVINGKVGKPVQVVLDLKGSQFEKTRSLTWAPLMGSSKNLCGYLTFPWKLVSKNVDAVRTAAKSINSSNLYSSFTGE